jgi:hypothetical protein
MLADLLWRMLGASLAWDAFDQPCGACLDVPFQQEAA